MRELIVVLVLSLLVVPVFAQGAKGDPFESSQYQVRASGPGGWKKTLDKPASRGTWLDLVKYEEEKTKAVMTLSVQASSFATSDAMIQWQRERFRKDANVAVLRDEIRSGGRKRPDGVFFEYTYQYKGRAQHAIAAYWFFGGRRYRVYATVREVGWRASFQDMESFVASVAFTGRIYSEEKQNWTDDALNYAIYFPENWTVRLPTSGPRAMFESKRLGVSVWLYVQSDETDLETNVNRTIRQLEEKGYRISKKGKPRTHPALGRQVWEFEYTKLVDGKKYRYRETSIFHRERFYRIVLAAAENSFPGGQEAYGRVVESISFKK